MYEGDYKGHTMIGRISRRAEAGYWEKRRNNFLHYVGNMMLDFRIHLISSGWAAVNMVMYLLVLLKW
jgi:hypothetical protein